MLSPGMLLKPSRNNGEGYRKLADGTPPFPRAQLEKCLLLGVITLENSWVATSETGKTVRQQCTGLREPGKVHARHKGLPTLICPFCQIHGRRQVAWEAFSQNSVYSFLGAKLRGKTSVTIREFFLGIHRTLCFFF